MNSIIIFTLETIILAFLLVFSLKYRERFGIVLFYMIMAVSLIISIIFSNQAIILFYGMYSYAAGAGAVFGLLILGILMLYDIYGVEKTRELSLGLIGTLIFFVILAAFFIVKLKGFTYSPPLHEFKEYAFRVIPLLWRGTPRIVLFTFIAIFVDIFLAVILSSITLFQKFPLFLRGLIIFVIIFVIDSLITIPGAFYGVLHIKWQRLLIAAFIMKIYLAIILSIIYALTLKWTELPS